MKFGCELKLLTSVIYQLNNSIFVKTYLSLLEIIECIFRNLKIMKCKLLLQVLTIIFLFFVCYIIDTINIDLLYLITLKLIS